MEKFHQINVENLLFKIEKFYKRFYINKLFRGIFFFFSIVLSFFLLFDAIFFYGDLSDFLRFIIFYGFILIVLSGIYYWILDPIFRLLRINKGLSLEEASKYIGGYYSEIGDKLLNTVQFYNQNSEDILMLAALNQNAGSFQGFDFVSAAPPVTTNKKIFYILIPVSFFIGLLVFNSKVITEGSNRLINYEVNYARIAPFEFKILGFEDRVISGDNVEVLLELNGDELPQSVNIDVNGNVFRMNHLSGNRFNYHLEDIHEDTRLIFLAGKYESRSYDIMVFKDVEITGIKAEIIFPDYMKLPNKLIDHPSLLQVPYGSRVHWNLNLNNSTNAYLAINNDTNRLDISKKLETEFVKEVFSDFDYDVVLNNVLSDNVIGFSGEVNVIADKYPDIVVKEVYENGIYSYTGSIEDDYGFKDLVVKLIIGDSLVRDRINVRDGVLLDVFSYQLDVDQYDESIKLSFEVRDNDVLHNYKMRESELFDIKILNDKEKRNELDQERDDLISDMDNLVRDKSLLDRDMDKLRKDLLDKKQLDWDSKKELESLLDKSTKHQEQLKELSERLEKHNHSYKNDNNVIDEELLDKQKQLNDLFNKLMDEESKKLLDELQKLLDELDKKKIQEHLDKMQMNNEELKDELDMNLEIFKQMEFEQEFSEVMNDLEKLAEEQLKLAEETLEKSDDPDLLDKQDSLNKEFENIEESLRKLDSLNNELDDPNEMNIDSNSVDEISSDQESAKDNLEKSEFEKSSNDQKKAGKKMKEMAERMQMNMQMQMNSQQGEDLESLRKILENLLVLSFDQEGLMMELRAIDQNDPRVVGINQDQKNMIENSNMVKDSLMALATRVYQLNEVITEDVSTISREMNLSVKELQERKFSETLMHQQKSLTAINNLAVLLDEIIQQMQEQQSQQNQSNGSCSKPGQGKPKPSMKKSKMKQQDLAKRMEQLKKELEKGNKPGQKNPGKMGMGMSKEIAEMAAQQEMIRREIQKMADELKKEGNMSGAGELKKLEELLEKNEEDMINFDLDNEFFMRQKEIEIRMLEAENAKRKRDLDHKRESEESRDIDYKNEDELEKYQLEKKYELELLRIFNPGLSNYYKGQVQIYNGEVKY
ncbi:hypothetical protein KFE94_07890 [bacterium SCSIO 12643]|nr:hypothetical protein KFE94_07890 [bacterium SCSIO 12643]